MLDFRLCVITEEWEGRTHLDVARAALAAGVGCIQFREKGRGTREMLDIGGQLLALCRAAGAVFIVNDRPDLALALDADGVHVGQDDMPAPVARRLFEAAGRRVMIGASASDLEDCIRAARDGADYVGAGPVFATGTKADAGAAIGIEMIAQMKSACGIPIVAIGGINAGNAADVLRAGAEAVAVISAVSRADDMEKAASGLLAAIASVPEQR